MHFWRISKYDPAKKHADGSDADASESTSSSDSEKSVGEKDDRQTEKKYLQAIRSFAEELGITKVVLRDLETDSQAGHFFSIWVNQKITIKDALKLSRWALREKLRCKLEVPDVFFVHFGYDDYMYIGACEDCPEAKEKVFVSGLFVADFRSPYL